MSDRRVLRNPNFKFASQLLTIFSRVFDADEHIVRPHQVIEPLTSCLYFKTIGGCSLLIIDLLIIIMLSCYMNLDKFAKFKLN